MEEHQVSRQRRFVDTMMPHTDQLHTYAYYLTGDKEQAADLLQETFLKAYRSFDSFEVGSNAKAWLYTITKNTFINSYRQKKRIPTVVEFNEEIFEHRHSNDMSPFGSNLEQTLSDDVATALASLPEKFKSIIILRDIEDMPYEEISEALDIPIGTVRSRLHRARGMLFTRLKSYAKSVGYEVSNRFNAADLAFAH